VSNVTVAALRRPAGRLTPILSSLSRNARPPFFDLALYYIYDYVITSLTTVRTTAVFSWIASLMLD